jgi:hypothetical protein
MTENKRWWAESQILPPHMALLILRDETQRIGAARLEKKTVEKGGTILESRVNH